MKRRTIISGLGSTAAAWPSGLRAQPAQRLRHVGVLMTLAADDPQGQQRLSGFVEGLHKLGWTDGRNLRIEKRWDAGQAEHARLYAAEMAALGPDVILAAGSVTVELAARAVPFLVLLQITFATPLASTSTRDTVTWISVSE